MPFFDKQRISELFSKAKASLGMGKREDYLDANNFNKEKEELSDYQSIVNSERANRKADLYAKQEKKLNKANEDKGSKEEKSSFIDLTSFGDEPEKESEEEKAREAAPRAKNENENIKKEAKTKEMPGGEKNKEKKGQKKESSMADSLRKKFSQNWEAPQILKTNLVRNEVTTFVDWGKNMKKFARASFIAVILVVLAYLGFFLWGLKMLNEGEKLDAEIDSLKIQVIKSAQTVNTVDIFQEKLKYADLLLEKHVYWTDFYGFLENNILKEIYLTSGFSGNTEGSYSFPAATDSFSTLTSQLEHLNKQPEVIRASVPGGSYDAVDKKEPAAGNSVLSFTMDIDIKPELFYR